MLREEEKKKLSDKILATINAPLLATFGGYLIKTVNRLFGEHQFTWKCFFRSLLASGFFLVILHLWYFALHGGIFDQTSGKLWLPFITGFLSFVLIFNSMDFFVLWKTRELLKVIVGGKRQYAVLLFLADIAVSFGFGVLKYIIVSGLLSFKFQVDWSYMIHNVIQLKDKANSADIRTDPWAVDALFFYGTFFYSSFLWLYFLAMFIVRRVSFLRRWKNRFQEKFSIEKEPVEFIKAVLAVLLMLLAVITFTLVTVFSHQSGAGTNKKKDEETFYQPRNQVLQIIKPDRHA